MLHIQLPDPTAYFYASSANLAAKTHMNLGQTKTIAMTKTNGHVQCCTDKPLQPMPAGKKPMTLLLLLGRLSQAWLSLAC